jgi:hypothetical protein
MRRYSQRREGVVLSLLILLPAAVWAESAIPDSADASPANPVWGDPEDAEEQHSGWTWFGMGYERRMRNVESDSGDNAGTEVSGKNGKDVK